MLFFYLATTLLILDKTSPHFKNSSLFAFLLLAICKQCWLHCFPSWLRTSSTASKFLFSNSWRGSKVCIPCRCISAKKWRLSVTGDLYNCVLFLKGSPPFLFAITCCIYLGQVNHPSIWNMRLAPPKSVQQALFTEAFTRSELRVWFAFLELTTWSINVFWPQISISLTHNRRK